MKTDREISLNSKMRALLESWRYRWCEPGLLGCGCMGGANRSGGLLREGYTKEEWEIWVKEHLKP